MTTLLFFLLACENPEPKDELDDSGLTAGPAWDAIFSVERWHRAHPAAEHTMAGLLLNHLGEGLPHWVDVDDSCGAFLSDWPAVDETPPSFGTIRMDGTDLGEVEWTNVNGIPSWAPWNDALVWDTGSRIKISAEGADLPAFEIEDVVPALATLTSIDLPSLKPQEMVLSRSVPLELTWDPVDSDVLLVVLQANEDWSSFGDGIWCEFPGAPGTATVSVDVLSRLMPSTTPEAVLSNFYFGGASQKLLNLEEVRIRMITWKAEVARILVE